MFVGLAFFFFACEATYAENNVCDGVIISRVDGSHPKIVFVSTSTHLNNYAISLCLP